MSSVPVLGATYLAIRITMFGGLAVHRNGTAITRFRTRKTAELLAFLAYFPRTVHTREELVELLWPGGDEALGRQNLSTSLSSLRRQLEPPGVEPESVIVSDRCSVSLRNEDLTTDVREFGALLGRARRGSDGVEAAALIEQALELYEGPLLPEMHDDWVLFERERLHEEYGLALAQLSERRRTSGDLGGAISLMRKALHAEPLVEEHYRNLSALLDESGNSEAAKQVLDDWEELLNNEFQPKARARRLAPERPRPNASSEPSPALLTAAGSERPANFHKFFGRRSEMDQIALWLRSEAEPLLTLTGPGGIGKSRLASEAIRAARATCYYIPLADLREQSQIPVELTRTVGAPPAFANSPEMLAAALKKSGRVVVFDNFEHILEGVNWLERLIASAPGLKILATSRQRLGLNAEKDMPLSPLAVPKAGESLEDLAASPAIALFVDRAQGSRPDFQITASNSESVRALCDGLEGIPLALELAAARSQVLTPGQMLAQMSERFSFLVNRRRPAAERHRTMAAALQWSFDLLRDDLKRSFAELSIFRGGWTLEATSAVLGEAHPEDFLDELVSASLVRVDDAAGEIRFSMLETIRAFGSTKLSTEDSARLLDRHAEHYLTLAERAAPGLMGPEQADWLPRLSLEQENFRAALEFASESAPELGMRLSVALAPYWDVRASSSESRKWLSEFLGKDDPFPTPLRMAALFGGGALCVLGGEFARAKEYLTECLAFARELGDPAYIANVLEALGTALTYLYLPEATSCFDEGLEIAEQLRDPVLKARMLFGRGIACLSNADFQEAHSRLESALDLAQTMGLAPLVPRTLSALGVNYNYWHRPERAEPILVEASRVAKEAGDFLMIPICDWGLAMSALQLGDIEKARRFNREHLKGLLEWGSGWGAQHYLECECRIELTLGDHPRAVTLFAAMMALRERSQMPFTEALRILYEGLDVKIEELRATGQFEEAWQLGYAMSWEQAVAFATMPDKTGFF
ncbi:MAG TPA: BTAD domain-containing putative transcriptional regulator [Fimbriimonadaceae bacterium]|nr:BTAD domain-containing putative transcriptional regulator [Fimbriimonadaceae bacterium]